jgi:CheY-like chemotaxis protein
MGNQAEQVIVAQLRSQEYGQEGTPGYPSIMLVAISLSEFYSIMLTGFGFCYNKLNGAIRWFPMGFLRARGKSEGEWCMTTPFALVIEDDELVVPIYVAAVTDAQYEPVVIRDGKEAVEKLQVIVPALVILDLRLPKVPGVRILQAIREDQRLANTRVIVVSADATLTEYVRERADLVLVKPVGYRQLREMAARLRPEDAM